MTEVNLALKELFIRSVKMTASFNGFTDQETTDFYKQILSDMKTVYGLDADQKYHVVVKSLLTALNSHIQMVIRGLSEKPLTYQWVV